MSLIPYLIASRLVLIIVVPIIIAKTKKVLDMIDSDLELLNTIDPEEVAKCFDLRGIFEVEDSIANLTEA